jgi:hypothetical protein
MRVIIKPSLTPHLHIDITNAMVSTIAAELARAQGGNDVLNWLEAERVLQDLLGSARSPSTREQPVGMDSRERVRRRRWALEEPDSVTRRVEQDEDAGVPMSATRG